MIYLIDHEDSFTFNLAHLLGLYDKVYISNYYEIDKSKLKEADTIVLSPGPGEPKNYPATTKIYNKYKGRKKIIGICLGFQQILYAEGGKIIAEGHPEKIAEINGSYTGNFLKNIINNKFKKTA